MLVTSTTQPPEVVTGYLNAYRILVSDLVVVTGGLDEELVEAIHRVKELPVVSVELRPRPVTPVLGRRIAYFTTAPAEAHAAIERHLREELGAEVVLVSGNLARREALREELARASRPRSTWSRSRRPRSTSSPRRRSSAGWRSCSPTTSSSRSACSTSTASWSGSPTRRSRARRCPVTDRRHRRPLPLGGEDGLPFSKGLLARSLTATGISTDRAYELALAAEADIAQGGLESISFERLGELAREKLGEEDGATTMRRLHRFQDLYDLDLPVILLVGGATGTGKSTVATDVAYRLGITRVTSTDFVRQTMRAFFSREFMPAIHYSSFEAGRAIADADAEGSEAVLDGFLEQTRDVLVGVQAAIERALEEGWSMVLEGVHLVPGMLPREIRRRARRPVRARDQRRRGAREPLLDPRHRLRGRAAVREVPRRASTTFGWCRRTSRDARRKNEVPVIENGNIEEAIGEVMELVLSAARAARGAVVTQTQPETRGDPLGQEARFCLCESYARVDGARCAGRGALARPGRAGDGRGGRLDGDAARARPAARSTARS